jgi:hypothetical protein
MDDIVTSRFAQWALDVHDIRKMAAFWPAALGHEMEHDGENPYLWPPTDAPRGSQTVWTAIDGSSKTRQKPCSS